MGFERTTIDIFETPPPIQIDEVENPIPICPANIPAVARTQKPTVRAGALSLTPQRESIESELGSLNSQC